MKRLLVPVGLILALIVPTSAQADPQPNNTDFRNAKQACTALRGDTPARNARPSARSSEPTPTGSA